MKSISYDFIYNEIKNKNGELLTTKDDYKNITTHICILCKKCNRSWKTTFRKIQLGRWCHFCAGNKKYTYDEVKLEIDKRGGTLISKEYKNINSPLDVRCNKCENIWHPQLNNIVGKQSSWCPYCKRKSRCQVELFNIVKDIFNTTVLFDYNGFDWLKTDSNHWKQEIDIYIPSLKLGIEYDGRQHFMPVCFGNVSKDQAILNFKRTQFLDEYKDKKIAAHPEDITTFIRIPYTESIDKDNVIRILVENDVQMPA